MKKTITRITGIILALLLAAGAFAVTSAPTEAATKTKTIAAATLSGGLQYTFKGLCYNGKNSPIHELDGKTLAFSTVQNFAVTPDGKYVFTTSECRTGTTKHTLLTRCLAPEEPGKEAEAPYQDAHVLKKYGHGESIAITQPDLTKEVYYIWMACDPNSNGFGTKIARLTYKVTDGVGKITKRVKIKNFKKANIINSKATTFQGCGSPDRMNVAADQDTNQIMFRLHFSNYNVSYVSYDLKKLNSALNKIANNKYYNIAKAVKWQKANVRFSQIPCGAFQSFDIIDNSIYLCGGSMEKGAQIYQIKYKLYKNGKAKEVNKEGMANVARIIKLKLKLKVAGKTLTQSSLEIEGMKLIKSGKKTYCYVNFFQNNTPIADNIGVYRFQV